MPQENDSNFLAILKQASNEDETAFKFLGLWVSYAHRFDDIVDGDIQLTAANLVECNNLLQRVLTNEFYLEHKTMLGLQLYLVGEAYAASESYRLNKDKATPAQLEWANFLRHAGNDVIRAVAAICGGESLLRTISEKLREYSIND